MVPCGSDFSSCCSQEVGFGNVSNLQSSSAELGPVSVDSTQQEPPGVCWTSRTACQGSSGLRSLSARFVCWLECFPQQSAATEDNADRPGNQEGCPGTVGACYSTPLDTASFPHGSCVFLPGLLPSLLWGWSRNWEVLFVTSSTSWKPRPGICQNVGMGVYGDWRDLLFHHQHDWHLSMPWPYPLVLQLY